MQTPTLVDTGQVTLAYETFGSPDHPPLVLVMGVATQMIGWPDEFCRALADDGFYVIRFDNRDIGLSKHLDDAGVPDLVALLTGRSTSAPYTLAEMADDTAALLDGLGLDRVHLVGLSMGGMIAQEVAIRHQERLISLTSISVPTLVLHGEEDPLIQVEGGHETAAAVPGSRLITYPGMGHDLPEDLWPTLIGEITAHVRRAAERES